jgi:hypothetical protein
MITIVGRLGADRDAQIDYSSRLVSGLTVAVHRRLPQREQRNRFTTVSSRASHPAIAAKVLGCAFRVCPHSHLSGRHHGLYINTATRYTLQI